MRHLRIRGALAACVFLSAMGGTCLAADYAKGEITKIDSTQKKLTIRHEELTNLDMPPMTMVFVVADDSMLEALSEGQAIEFIAERVNGKLTVTEIK